MRVAIVGGKLQGLEAAYLARKAGWEAMVIDKDRDVPASGLSDRFVQLDVIEERVLTRILKTVDLLIPALENEEALASLERASAAADIPITFDPGAYTVSLSKVKANELFKSLGLPTPKSWPESRFPMVAKPNKGSGSQGVRILSNTDELQEFTGVGNDQQDWVLEELVCGPSYSLEVTGFPGAYTTHQVTDLEMDAAYDCKRVVVPTVLSAELIAEFEKTAVTIAEALELRGLMDVEVILHDGVLKVLEVDARLPSQTPTAVYWSTGFNMVKLLGEMFLTGLKPGLPYRSSSRAVVYEHVRSSHNCLETRGEHIMAEAGPLQLCRDFFGADEALTNYRPGRSTWVATLIISGNNREEALGRRDRVIEEIQRWFGLGVYSDPVPEDYLEGICRHDSTPSRRHCACWGVAG